MTLLVWAPIPLGSNRAWSSALLELATFALLGAWLVAFLSPASAHMHSLAQDAGMSQRWITLSIDPQASRVSLLKSLCYCGVFFLVLALANTRSRVVMLARVLVYAALVLAVYGVL